MFLKRIHEGLRCHRATLFLYVCSVALIFSVFLIFDYEVKAVRVGFISNLLLIAGDIMLILTPYWLIPNRAKWTAVFATAFISLFFLFNIWYYRFWGVHLPMSALTMVDNVNGLLLGSVAGLFEFSDLLIFVPLIVQIIIVIYIKKFLKAEKSYTNCSRIAMVAMSVLFFLVTQTWISEKNRRWHKIYYGKDISLADKTRERLNIGISDSRSYYYTNGLPILLTKMLSEAYKSRNLLVKLSEEQQAEVTAFINERINSVNKIEGADSLKKNIVFIIVESLNGNVLDRKINGREITPVLNSLTREEGTVFSRNMLSQVCEGASGDGQLIYNAGVLPLATGATPMNIVPKIEFSPLVEQFSDDYGRLAFFADDGKSWNQELAFGKYGFNSIYNSEDYGSADKTRGHDGAMFDFGLETISKLPEPFFAEFVTISMHVPFNDNGVQGYDYIVNDSLTDFENNYHRMTAYFDAELGRFISGLKESGLYDKTLIFIASDHSQGLTQEQIFDSDDKNIPTVFIAANTPVTGQITKPVGQIDVFPTILQLSGVGDIKFAGVGIPMTDSLRNSTDAIDSIREVSRLLLTGNAFLQN